MKDIGSNFNRLLIAADCKVDTIFMNTLENRLRVRSDIFYIDSTGEKRIQKINRHISYLVIAGKTFVHRNNYKYIVFWQQFIGFYYGIISGLCANRRHSSISLVLPLIYKQRNGLFGKIYKFLFRYFLNSDALDFFICHSAREQEFYINEFGKKYQHKIHFVRYGMKTPEDNQIVAVDDDKECYFFSGGTSNRDYDTLLKAFKGLREKLKIACFPSDVKNLDIPSNVEVLHNVFKQDFFDYMRKAYVIVISLDDPRISSGHLVLLDAMRLGKAIIATRGGCVEDYLDETCAMLIEPHSVMDLRKAVIELMNDKQRLSSLAMNARSRYGTDFTIEKYGQRIASILRDA